MDIKVVIALVGVVMTVQGAAVSEVKVIKHIHHSPEPEHHDKHDWGHPSYKFSYKVEDHKTHDFKGQHETREGKMVRGEYWLIEPDGTKRTVKYHTDEHGGFHTLVMRTPSHRHHEEPAPVEEHGGEEHAPQEVHKPVHHSQVHYAYDVHHHKPHHPIMHHQTHHNVPHKYKSHGYQSKHQKSSFGGEEGGQDGESEGSAQGGEE